MLGRNNAHVGAKGLGSPREALVYEEMGVVLICN